jgi:outer membrane lipoprotein carrier protein
MHRGESGVLELQKPGKMRWDYKSKAGKLFLLDGKFAWFYSPGDPVVQRIPAARLDDLRSPLRFLLGHTKIEAELSGLSVSAASSSAMLLSGIPKGMEKRVARLTLTVTPAGAISAISIEELDGARTSFVFTGEEANPKLPDSDFHFPKPAGVPVVDAPAPV